MAEISVYTHNRYVKVGLRQCCHAANKPCTRRLWRSSGLSNADGNRFRKIFSTLVFCRAGCYLLIEIVFDPSPKLYQRAAAADWPERAYISFADERARAIERRNWNCGRATAADECNVSLRLLAVICD
jgi:hypothetical protein